MHVKTDSSPTLSRTAMGRGEEGGGEGNSLISPGIW